MLPSFALAHPLLMCGQTSVYGNAEVRIWLACRQVYTGQYNKTLLGKHQNYLTQDGKINTPLLYRYAQECNTDLLTLLSTDDDARNEFFIRHGEHIIFVRDRFIDYIHHKDFLANSYTAYKNKIGLTGLARYGQISLLKSMHDVVLSFPFKDCVLEGGQNKDEAKRTEQ